MNFWRLLFILLVIEAAHAHPPKSKLRVRYFVEWVYLSGAIDAESTGDAVKVFKVCLEGRCSSMGLRDSKQPCPPQFVCETVLVKEKKLAGGGYEYDVQNWLWSRKEHQPLRLKPLDYSTVTNQAAARERAMEMIRRLLICHDLSVHQFDMGASRRTDASRTLECKCDTQ